MGTRDNVSKLLKANREVRFCATCLRLELGGIAAPTIYAAVSDLTWRDRGEMIGITRVAGICGRCGNRRSVVYAR